MAERRRRKRIDRSRYTDYKKVADHLQEAAEACITLEYWTAAGVLLVHSAIAFTDALCIMLSGERSVSDDHEDAVALLESVAAGGEEKQKALNHLRRIIEEKTKVSYLGVLYGSREVHEMWRRLTRFREWAIAILDR